MQMKQDTFIFSYKRNLILLFFTRSKFNQRSRIVASSSQEMFQSRPDHFDLKEFEFLQLQVEAERLLFACKCSDISFQFQRVIRHSCFSQGSKLNQSRRIVTTCSHEMFLSLVSNGNLILLFFLYGSCKFNYSSQVTSYCSQDIKQKRSFPFWTVLGLRSSSLFIFNEHLIHDIFSVRYF